MYVGMNMDTHTIQIIQSNVTNERNIIRYNTYF